MIASFRDDGTRDIFDNVNSKKARATLPRSLVGVARRKLSQINAARSLEELRLPGNHLEALHGDREGQWSVRVNERYRICFVSDGGTFRDVEIVDYH